MTTTALPWSWKGTREATIHQRFWNTCIGQVRWVMPLCFSCSECLKQWKRNDKKKEKKTEILSWNAVNRPFPHSHKKYSKCMKMSTPTSLWCYCSYALKWNAEKVYCQFLGSKTKGIPKRSLTNPWEWLLGHLSWWFHFLACLFLHAFTYISKQPLFPSSYHTIPKISWLCCLSYRLPHSKLNTVTFLDRFWSWLTAGQPYQRKASTDSWLYIRFPLFISWSLISGFILVCCVLCLALLLVFRRHRWVKSNHALLVTGYLLTQLNKVSLLLCFLWW